MLKPIKDHLKPGLDIIFVGFNPSIRSAETGHHFANPNNRFWKILYEAGITPKKFLPQEDSLLLDLNIGLTNIVPRPTKAADEITREEYKEGRERLISLITELKPKAVCFVGKGVYLEYSGSKKAPWGRQDISIVPGVIEFAAPSSSGLVRMKMDEVIDIYKELPAIVYEQAPSRHGEDS
ncbi:MULTISPECIES: G/U mismatch-specific DNA glycosylase [Bacillaceae]|uniref:DNA glycosylase n=2 Tax=Bacillus infantis TaxID=324767 RepID=U5LCA0_9BACI|nr:MULTISPECIES: G/U mismatch-specific DNA glycosylase [Bacillus]AGX04321.1 DNA glycosylase [Bacillus infantis NRRL B-14911]MCA1034758.1 G/U mismatch-specific DNA glycosylase [Bacillus infantis]MCK6205258.1 G/U mismatch-specific DNA glycosylase [Bacillus infantis]MCP1158439.1 G/U mismatch-specific DNA glycosylase [Bacillus infantis]MDW2879013.1 G/U mismatch-specific DNA glycosylase [Bacillus infantis]